MKCFDRFRLDVANQCLWQGQTRVTLMPKPFDLLTYLVEHAGRLVTHDEILKAVWPGTHVQSDVLRKHVKEIRRALGDAAATPRFVETVPKRGYRFVAPVWESGDASADVAIAPQLVGREPIFTALNDRLHQALAGERQLVFVTGEAGIGKTSLVEAFARATNAVPSLRVAWGQAVEGFGGKEPYYPLLEALGRLGRGPDGGPIVDALATCAPTWLIQLPSLLPAERHAALSRDVVGATTPRMVRELCEALETMTRTIPLVIILEDLHWGDRSTLDALSAIARRRERARLLIAATCRPVNMPGGEDPLNDLRRDLCVHGLAKELALTPLGTPEIGTYISGRFSPNAFPAGLETVLYRHSAGNPLFMSAMADHLVQRRVLDWDGTCWRMTMEIDQIAADVPDTLRHILELQVEQLTDLEGAALMCGSVAGERFTSWDVATMLGREEIDADAVFDALVKRGQFLRAVDDGGFTGRPRTSAFEFKHVLYREALYRRLPAALRTTHHQRLAEGLELLLAAGNEDLGGEVAAHYEAARVHDRAVTALMAAAQTALRRYAHTEALALLAQACELNKITRDDGRGEREVELFQRSGDVQYARGEMTAAAHAYEHAAAAAIDRRHWAVAAHGLVRAARAAVFFDVPRALADCERAAHLARDRRMPALETRARLVKQCWDLLHRGWSRDLSTAAAGAFGRLVQSPDDITPADHILYANVQVFRSEYAEASQRADAALRDLGVTGTLWEHLGAMGAKAAALALLGRWGEAHDTLEAGIEMAARNDNGPWLDILHGLLGSLHLQACDFPGARAIAVDRLPAAAGDRRASSQMHLTIISGAAELGLGNIREAHERFSSASATSPGSQPIIHWYWRLQARLGLAETALAAGDLAQANDEIVSLTDAVSNLDESAIGALAWECRARIALARNALDAAEVSVGRALDRLARVEVPGVAWRVHATAAALRRSTDPSRAAAHLEHARTILTTLAASLDGHESLQHSLLAFPAIRALLGS